MLMKLDKGELTDRHRLQVDYVPVALKQEGKFHSIFHIAKTSKYKIVHALLIVYLHIAEWFKKISQKRYVFICV